jgi:hypothetical protein
LGRAKLTRETFNALGELDSIIRTPFETSAREHDRIECFSSSQESVSPGLKTFALAPSPAVVAVNACLTL